MNNYLFGGLIHRRTFTLFVSAIAFFAVLLGVGLGISVFAEGDEETTPYAYVEIINTPQTLAKAFETMQLAGSDFDGLTYRIVLPVGCPQNLNGTEDIVETITIDGADVSNVTVDQEDETYPITVEATHQQGDKSQPITMYYIEGNDSVCDVHITFGVDVENCDDLSGATFVSLEEGFTTVRTDDFFYFVGEDEVYTVYHHGEGGDVVVPATYDGKPVTSILYHTFADTSKFRSITVPEGVTTIESEAFILLSELEEINLPSTAVNVQPDSFLFYYNDLKEINVADGNTKIYNQNNDGALYYDNGDGTKQIIIYPAEKEGTEFTVGNDVSEIAPYAFTDALNLTTVNMPADADSKLEKIGDAAFHTSGITAIDLPSSVTEIGESVFGKCKNLSSLELGGVKKIPYGMCQYYSSEENDTPSLTTFVVPDSVTFIDDYAFFGQALTDITIPYSVNSIGYGAVRGSEAAPVKVHGTAGTEAEEYCKKYGTENYLQFVNDVVDEFVRIPFEVVGGDRTYRTFTVTIIDGENREEIEISPNGDKDMICCADIAEGKTVDIVISKKGYLSYTLNDFTVGETEIPTDIKMYAGDVNGDGNINIVDIGALVDKNATRLEEYYGPEIGSEDFKNYWHYDFDESGYINILDIAAAIESFCAVNNAG